MVIFWFALLALSMLLYVLLDGFDLGVGMLFGVARNEQPRLAMMSAIAPIWDGNETWLVVAGVILFGAFPLVYSTLMSAFYLPVLFMLGGLILRGAAFEFRHQAKRARWVWGASFAGGSLVAAFMQGLMVGALVEGLPLSGGRYVGGMFGWLSPFALICGVGLCVAYALLGACWLIRKCEGQVRDAAYRLISPLSVAVVVFVVIVFAIALNAHLLILNRWLQRPYLFVCPLTGSLAAIALAVSVRRRRDASPFYLAALTFAAAFGALAISFWPYIIPFSITIDQAAAPRSSLAFMLWAGVFVFPLMLMYTAISLRVFRGKVADEAANY